MRVRVAEQLRDLWRQATGYGAQNSNGRGESALNAGVEAGAEAERRTLALPAILTPVQFPARHLPKPTPANLRRFAETLKKG